MFLLCCHIPGHSYYSWVWWCCAWNLVWQVLRCLVCSLWNLIFCSACGKDLFWEWFDVVCCGLKIMVYMQSWEKEKNCIHACPSKSSSQNLLVRGIDLSLPLLRLNLQKSYLGPWPSVEWNWKVTCLAGKSVCLWDNCATLFSSPDYKQKWNITSLVHW